MTMMTLKIVPALWMVCSISIKYREDGILYPMALTHISCIVCLVPGNHYFLSIIITLNHVFSFTDLNSLTELNYRYLYTLLNEKYELFFFIIKSDRCFSLLLLSNAHGKGKIFVLSFFYVGCDAFCLLLTWLFLLYYLHMCLLLPLPKGINQDLFVYYLKFPFIHNQMLRKRYYVYCIQDSFCRQRVVG